MKLKNCLKIVLYLPLMLMMDKDLLSAATAKIYPKIQIIASSDLPENFKERFDRDELRMSDNTYRYTIQRMNREHSYSLKDELEDYLAPQKYSSNSNQLLRVEDKNEEEIRKETFEAKLFEDSRRFHYQKSQEIAFYLKKFLREYHIPVVDENGELIVIVRIADTYQYSTVQEPIIMKVNLKGLKEGHEVLGLEFNQNKELQFGASHLKRSVKQIGKVLAKDIKTWLDRNLPH